MYVSRLALNMPSRRSVLASLGSAGIAATAGCSTVRDSKSLSDPTVSGDSGQSKTLVFSSDGTEVAKLNFSGAISSGQINLESELWHERGTTVESITLQVWMPSNRPGPAADVAVVSPVEGDSSPAPFISPYTPERGKGTVIEITDLDDLKDETISTINLIVQPREKAGTELIIDSEIELGGGGLFTSGYSLSGRFDLDFPALEDQ